MDNLGAVERARGGEDPSIGLERFFGKWFPERGGNLRHEYDRALNVRTVITLASNKIDGDGSVPPRVAAPIIESAQWADDEYVAKYLAGILASSRTPSGTDDRGLPWARLVDRMTKDETRLHHALYSGLRAKVLGDRDENYSKWTQDGVIVDQVELAEALGWDYSTTVDQVRVLEAAYGLRREGLVENVSHGTDEFLNHTARVLGLHLVPPGNYMHLYPTAMGIGLFLRVNGHGDSWLTELSNADLEFTLPGSQDGTPDPVKLTFTDELPFRQVWGPDGERLDMGGPTLPG